VAVVAGAADVPDATAPGWRIAGHLTNTAIREASGLAPSRRCADRLWIVNDSGNPARLWAVDSRGRDIASLDIEGAANEDWEDLASVVLDGRPWLAIADCGDNLGIRDGIFVHFVEEPETERVAPLAVRPALSLSIRFEDGARDCEAAAVDPTERTVLLLSKRDPRPALYLVRLPPAPTWTSAVHSAVAHRAAVFASWPPPQGGSNRGVLGNIGNQPTAMDLSPDGRRLLILTYEDAWIVERRAGEDWAIAAARPMLRAEMPDPAEGVLRRREAACWSADGACFFVTGEGNEPPLLRAVPPPPTLRSPTDR